MLAIASAFVSEPRFLVLDEPTSGLAPIVVDRLIEQILACARAGTTILWIVGDDPARSAQHADRVYLLQSGVVGGQWSGSKFIQDVQLSELYFRSDNIESSGQGRPVISGS